MKKYFLLTLLITLFSSNANTQTPYWQWVESAYGFSNDDKNYSICTDANGNIYVAGSFNSDNFIFGNDTLINPSNNGNDAMFVVKYSKAGKVIWKKAFGNINSFGNFPNSISTDINGNIYLAGSFGPTTIFGKDTLTNPGAYSTGDYAMFVTKFDSFGNEIWAKSGLGVDFNAFDGGVYESNVITDANMNVYVIGNVTDSLIIFDRTKIKLDSIGYGAFFMVKYDSFGNVIWAQANSSSNYITSGLGISVDGNNNIYATGSFNGSVIFGNDTLVNPSFEDGAQALFVAKYDSLGKNIWARSAGINSNIFNPSASCADAKGNVYVTGYFNSPYAIFGSDTLFDTNSPANNNGDTSANIFVAKYNSSGTLVWAKSADEINAQAGINGMGICVDVIGNIYVTGSFSGTVAFGTDTLVGSDLFYVPNVFSVKYDQSGNVIWAKNTTSGGENDYVSACGTGIVADTSGNVYISGWIEGTTAFGNDTLSIGWVGMFTAKLSNTCITTSTFNEYICQGQSYGKYNSTGTYNDTFILASGCDSIRTLNLTVSTVIQDTITQSICYGQYYGNHNISGTYIDTFIAQGGCDSVRVLYLTTSPIISILEQTICPGQSYVGYDSTGTYSDTFTVAGGCDSVRILFLTVSQYINTENYQTIYQGQSYNGDSVTGTYFDTITGTQGCDTIKVLFLQVINLNGNVWPGDINSDGIADNYDMLALGLAYNDTGSVRPNATTNWTGQYCPAWIDTFQTGVNINHADCDGNGVVDYNDIQVIELNYGLTHNKTNQYQRTPGAPPLYLELLNAPVAIGDTAKFKIMLGYESITANNFYGLAFSIQYNNTLVLPNSLQLQFSNSWLGEEGSDLISLSKEFTGQFDLAIVRTDHQNRSGLGAIGEINFVAQRNINGNSDSILNELNITGLQAIDNTGNLLPTNVISTNSILNGITEISTTPQLSIYPNPASENINIVSSYEMNDYIIYNAVGQEINRKENIHAKQTAIDVSAWAKGIYFLQATTDGEKISRRFAVIR